MDDIEEPVPETPLTQPEIDLSDDSVSFESAGKSLSIPVATDGFSSSDDELEVNVGVGSSIMTQGGCSWLQEDGEEALVDPSRAEYKSRRLENLLDRYPERRRHLKRLAESFGSLFMEVPPLLVWGPAGSGKAMCVLEALRAQGSKHSVVDCRYVSNRSQFFSGVMAGFESGGGGRGLDDFLEKLGTECRQMGSSWADLTEAERLDGEPMGYCSTRYLVIRHAELLSDLADPALSFLLQPAETFPGGNLGVILTSTRPWELISPGTSQVRPPRSIYFENYTQPQLVDILVRTRGSGLCTILGRGQHQRVVSVAREQNESIDVFVSRHFRELARIVTQRVWSVARAVDAVATVALALFPRYIEPVLTRGKSAASQSTLGMRHAIEPWLHPQILTLVQAGVLNRNQILNMNASTDALMDESDISARLVSIAASDAAENLPRPVRWVLVAAYLASYVARADDARFFGEGIAGMKSRQAAEGDALENDSPGWFERPRLRYIAWTLSDDENVTIQLGAVINSLIGWKMLETDKNKVGKRLRCMVDFDTASIVAASLGFEEFEAFLRR